LDASAGVSIASVKFNVMTVSANAERSATGISAGVNATLVSIQFDAGPLSISCGIKASTGISAGIDGIEAQFLGTGFRFGPKKITLHTTFVDVSVNPNVIIGALFIAISNIPPNEIDPKNFDDFQLLIAEITKFFGGKPPPSPPPTPIAITNRTVTIKPKTTITQTLQSEPVHSNVERNVLRQRTPIRRERNLLNVILSVILHPFIYNTRQETRQETRQGKRLLMTN
jgi:hypothetical protein